MIISISLFCRLFRLQSWPGCSRRKEWAARDLDCECPRGECSASSARPSQFALLCLAGNTGCCESAVGC